MLRNILFTFIYYCSGGILSNIFMSVLAIVYAPVSLDNNNKNPWKLAYHLSNINYEIASLLLSIAILLFISNKSIIGIIILSLSFVCGYCVPVIMRSIIATIGVNLTMRYPMKMKYSRNYILPKNPISAISIQEFLVGMCVAIAFTWNQYSIPFYMVIGSSLLLLSIWLMIADYLILSQI